MQTRSQTTKGKEEKKEQEHKTQHPVEGHPQSQYLGEKGIQVDAQPFVLGAEKPEIPLFCTITFYGKRRSGKSVCMRWLFDYYRIYYPYVWVFTLTKHNKFFHAFIPEKFVMPQFSADSIHGIMNVQIETKKRFMERPYSFNPRKAIIWDDYNGNDIK